ncbi:ABC transporter substrate-binding protein [bacterium]|nr:MAG: ABC transporter substrate-binding protein [bacterium]
MRRPAFIAGLTSALLAPSAVRAAPGVLRTATIHGLDDPDPYIGTTPLSPIIAWAYADGLVATSTGGRIVPALAASLPDRSADGLVYRYTLRRDVRWHDGAQLRGQDVQTAFSRLSKRADLRSTPPFDTVADIAATDHTITVRLRRPFGAFVEQFFGPRGALPLPLVRPGHIGTGPFQVQRVQPNISAVLTRAGGGPRGAAALGELRIETIPDKNSLLVAYESHEIDVAIYPPTETAAAYAKAGARIYRQDGTTLMILANCAAGPMADAALRQAVFASIDRREIAHAAFGEWLQPSALLPEPRLPELTTARALLARTRPHLRIIATEGHPGQVALLVQQMLQDAGASVEIVHISIPQFFSPDGPVHRGSYDLTLWFSDLATPDLRPILGCRAPQNVSGWCAPAFDALEASAAGTRGAASATALTHADALLNDAAPMLPLGRFQLAIASNPDVSLFVDEHAPLFMHVERWRT